MGLRAAILIIDDDPNLRATLTWILEHSGYQVTPTASAQDGLQCLQGRHYAMAVLDVASLEQDGLRLIPEIHRLCPHIPVLILATGVMSEMDREMLGASGSGYLIKPVEPERILAHIHALCPTSCT